MITVLSNASPGPQIVTIDSDSNGPTMANGFRRQLPNIHTNLNGLNLTPNPFNILTTTAVANLTEERHDDKYNPQSPEPSEPSPISTSPMNLSIIEGWETPHTTKDNIIFYSDHEPRRVYFL